MIPYVTPRILKGGYKSPLLQLERTAHARAILQPFIHSNVVAN